MCWGLKTFKSVVGMLLVYLPLIKDDKTVTFEEDLALPNDSSSKPSLGY